LGDDVATTSLSLLQDVVLASGGVLSLATIGVDVMPGVGCYLMDDTPLSQNHIHLFLLASIKR
jgi:hypothetical protein